MGNTKVLDLLCACFLSAIVSVVARSEDLELLIARQCCDLVPWLTRCVLKIVWAMNFIGVFLLMATIPYMFAISSSLGMVKDALAITFVLDIDHLFYQETLDRRVRQRFDSIAPDGSALLRNSSWLLCCGNFTFMASIYLCIRLGPWARDGSIDAVWRLHDVIAALSWTWFPLRAAIFQTVFYIHQARHASALGRITAILRSAISF